MLEKKWEDTQKLKVLCETRWASRADWLAVFVNAFKSPDHDLIQASEEAKTCSSVLNAKQNDYDTVCLDGKGY